MTDDVIELDVRDALRRGEEPLGKIMQVVKQLEGGQSLRLLATFEPIPLFHVMESMGFDHKARQIAPGDWEVLFHPRNDPPAKAPGPPATAEEARGKDPWPAPDRTLDNRGLMPPEPMIRVLDALEHLAQGQVQEVLNDREPMFLYPELERRGFAVRTEKRRDGVRLLIKRDAGGGPHE